MNISETYRELNRKLHADNANYGAGDSTSCWYPLVAEYALMLGATSILDYGSGKSRMGHTLSHMMVIPYDPAVPGIDAPPEEHDLVVSLDVLEHIEPECLDEVLDDIQRCAKKGVFLTVNMQPAIKVLADGRNAHLIQEPIEWWLPKLMARWDLLAVKQNGHGFDFLFTGLAKKKVVFVPAARAAA